ncbi:MAG: tetratricopeptide repeat protein [Chloroflexi bacterium]|nr:tetratricopeptide repeat protein [Chloroflexota bacterium]
MFLPRFLAASYHVMKSLSSGFYYNWGMNYARWGQPARAMYYLNRAAKLNTTGAQIFYQRGLLYIAMGLPSAAIADFNTAIESNPKYMEAYLNRGLMLTMTGKHEAARKDIDSAVGMGADRASLEAQITELRDQVG